MAKLLSSLLFSSLAFGQNSTKTDPRSAIEKAKNIVQSEFYATENSITYVQLQQSWVNQAEEKLNEVGYLPESIINGLKLLEKENDRVNNLHCEGADCVVPFGLDRIWNYGCWCNFGDNLMKGHGQPQNVFDSICKDFSRCLRCAKFDGNQENFECDPIVQTYTTGSGPDFMSKCSAGNPDDQCAVYVCSCEQTIISEIMDLAFQPHSPENEYTDEFLHSNGWSWDENCPVAKTPPAMEKDCCGLYPKRFPYTVKPSKFCCDGVSLYNPFARDCCVDGTVADIGSCM